MVLCLLTSASRLSFPSVILSSSRAVHIANDRILFQRKRKSGCNARTCYQCAYTLVYVSPRVLFESVNNNNNIIIVLLFESCSRDSSSIDFHLLLDCQPRRNIYRQLLRHTSYFNIVRRINNVLNLNIEKQKYGVIIIIMIVIIRIVCTIT